MDEPVEHLGAALILALAIVTDGQRKDAHRLERILRAKLKRSVQNLDCPIEIAPDHMAER